MEILVDTFGADSGIEPSIVGAFEAYRKIKSKIILVGDEDKIKDILNSKYSKEKANDFLSKIKIMDAKDCIKNSDEAAFAIKNKKESTIVKAYDYMKEKPNTIFVSAGSTGAVMAGGLLKLKRLDGVHRPALAIILPTEDGTGTILLDCGANAEAAEISMVQYAHIGEIYAKQVMRKKNIKIGLLNIGTEEEKGSLELKNMNRAIKDSCEGFIGNIEAREILSGKADVVVATGIMGNVALKAIEGTARIMQKALKQEFTKNFTNKIKAFICKGLVKRALGKYDYTQYGGAVLLGIKKPVIKIHGNAKSKNFKVAIIQAEEILQTRLVDLVAEKINGEKIQM